MNNENPKLVQRPLSIYLGDLTYTTLSLATDAFPLNIGFIAAYTDKTFGKEVELKEIEKKWNSMTSLMDRMEFNRFFSSQAKDRDWVESKKRGFYRLRPSWKGIFEV